MSQTPIETCPAPALQGASPIASRLPPDCLPIAGPAKSGKEEKAITPRNPGKAGAVQCAQRITAAQRRRDGVWGFAPAGSAGRLARSAGGNGKSVHLAGKLGLEGFVNEAVALEAGLAPEDRRLDQHPKVALAGPGSTGVPGMEMRFIDDLKTRWLKGGQQPLADRRLNGHRARPPVIWPQRPAPWPGLWPHYNATGLGATLILCPPRLFHILKAMKLDSKYFDSVRVKPDHARDAREEAPTCQWRGCAAAGLHRAPKGRGREGQYYLFCLDHVREFNASYNYFEGMSNADVEAYQKDSLTGHRPTWKVGANSWAHGTRHGLSPGSGRRFRDHHDILFGSDGELGTGGEPRRRQLKPLELKSLEALNLTAAATRGEIKSRFHELVKRHHPDANGGDNRSEDKLREIIQAYNYLKQAGLV